MTEPQPQQPEPVEPEPVKKIEPLPSPRGTHPQPKGPTGGRG